ncbi:MAG: PEP-CTERM-box response regulator transcription factor [Candidatus Krumholzibacteriales bacterium]
MPSTRLLIVDDEETIRKQLEWALKDSYGITTAGTAPEAVQQVKTFKPDLIILDLSLSSDPEKFEGFEVLESALRINPEVKIIVITGHDQKENALKAIREGAHDFYTKPVEIEELRVILKRAAHVHRLELELKNLIKETGDKNEFEGIIALSPSMREVFATIKKIAPTDVTVLITGESGTGKELAARAIHSKSERRNRPFVTINCGAIPENLLESELFGHRKGSFTGAHADKMGKFEAADGGTLFLDEIGELPQSLQVKLLRFLQDHIIERVGGNKQIQLDVRIVAATNRDLDSMMEKGDFRQDLFYRINTINITLPPLRDRGNDILLLAKFFLNYYNRSLGRNITGFSDPAREILYRYGWPGNVRELENRIKRAVIMCSGRTIEQSDLDLESGREEEGSPGGEGIDNFADAYQRISLKDARSRIEKKVISGALIRTSGNISAAAEQLDVSRPTLHDLINKYDINADSFRRKSH